MLEPVAGRIHSVETFGAVDGPGIRYVVFVQGCPLRCLYCHNPDSWAQAGGVLTDSAQVVAGILPYRNFIRRGGVTVSGGEPLFQPEFTADILRRCKAEGLHTALDTAGSVALPLARPAIDAADLVLLDIKTLDPALHQELTGKPPEHPLATLEYCRSIGKPVWVRHVLVPGYTLEPDRLEALASFLAAYPNLQRVELLAFHKMGEFKWKELGERYQLYDTPAPTPAQVEEAKAIFARQGLTVC